MDKRYLAHVEERKDDIIELILESVAHDFERPLGMISLNHESMSFCVSQMEHSTEKEYMENSLAQIYAATLFLNRFTANFVELRRCLDHAIEAQQQLVDLASVLRSVCMDSEAIYEAIKIRLAIELPPKGVHIMADRSFVEHICLNLLSNALRACNEDGTILFRLETNETEHRLYVIDDGCGMSEDVLKMLFRIENTSDLPYNPRFEDGSRMGLYLCKKYCDKMGWNIRAVPQKVGTMFEVRIPIVDEDRIRSVCLHSPLYDQAVLAQETRRAVLRELRTVPGLAGLGKDNTLIVKKV